MQKLSTRIRCLAAVLLAGSLALVPAHAQEADSGKRGSRLQGKASAGRRAPVVGATVIARQLGDGDTFWVTSTGEGGAFRMDGLPDGDYTVEFRRHGMTSVVKSGITVKFPFRAVVEVEMSRGESRPATAGPPATSAAVRLEGTVTDPDGKPLPEVRLRLVRPDGSHDPRMAITDAAGRFVLESVPTGTWEAEVSAVGHLTIRGSARVTRDSTLRIYLIEQPPGYDPSPLDLMPPEQPIPPEGLG